MELCLPIPGYGRPAAPTPASLSEAAYSMSHCAAHARHDRSDVFLDRLGLLIAPGLGFIAFGASESHRCVRVRFGALVAVSIRIEPKTRGCFPIRFPRFAESIRIDAAVQ
jgi:hypothetical protein